MLKMIIADDERVSRDGMVNACSRANLGVEVCAVAKNGREALTLIELQRPDIAVMDIRMPFLSGLDVIERTHAMKLQIEYIIVSGYADFEYAKKAMAFGVKHYVEKPCSNAELFEAIRQAADAVRDRQLLSDFYSGRDLSAEARSRCAEILSIDQTQHGCHAMVRDVIDYVRQHYDDERISLNYLAESVCFTSADYLGRLFKRDVGESFNTYLMRWRMTQARFMLLRKPPMKIYEVAKACGFGDNPQYFSQRFRQVTGMTPREFANRHDDG